MHDSRVIITNIHFPFQIMESFILFLPTDIKTETNNSVRIGKQIMYLPCTQELISLTPVTYDLNITWILLMPQWFFAARFLSAKMGFNQIIPILVNPSDLIKHTGKRTKHWSDVSSGPAHLSNQTFNKTAARKQRRCRSQHKKRDVMRGLFAF